MQNNTVIPLVLVRDELSNEYYQLETCNYFPILASIVMTLVKIRQKLRNLSLRFIKKSQSFL